MQMLCAESHFPFVFSSFTEVNGDLRDFCCSGLDAGDPETLAPPVTLRTLTSNSMSLPLSCMDFYLGSTGMLASYGTVIVVLELSRGVIPPRAFAPLPSLSAF